MKTTTATPEIDLVTAAVEAFCSAMLDISRPGYATELGAVGKRGLAETLAQLDRVRGRLVDLFEETTIHVEQYLDDHTVGPFVHGLGEMHAAGDVVFNTVAELDTKTGKAML